MTPMHAIRMKAVPAMTKNELITTAMSILGPRQVCPLDVTRKDHRAHKRDEAHDQAYLEKHRLIRCNCIHDGETDADVSEQVYRHHAVGKRGPDDDAIRHQQKTNDVQHGGYGQHDLHDRRADDDGGGVPAGLTA